MSDQLRSQALQVPERQQQSVDVRLRSDDAAVGAHLTQL